MRERKGGSETESGRESAGGRCEREDGGRERERGREGEVEKERRVEGGEDFESSSTH